MKKRGIVLALVVFILPACALHFHLDFLGKESMEEIFLIQSTAKEKIVLLDIEGMISSLPNPELFSREGDLLSQVYVRLEKAAADNRVKGIILRLDTPGGEVTATEILYNEIMKFRKKTKRPVVGLMMGVAASGGYYVASACDYVIAHPSTITGSIGVISLFPDVEVLFDKIGIKVNVAKSGEMKDSGSPFRSLTPEEKKVFQGIIDEFYEDFLQAVYQSRKSYLSLDGLRKIADGRVYTARQAQELKLIDEVGYFDTALKKILTMASLPEANVIAYTYFPKKKTNIYASSLQDDSPFKSENLERLLPFLKSGFYYLWLPQLARE